MTIRQAGSGVIELEGECAVEEADALLQQLLANPAAVVDWERCDQAHTAVIQVLLLARPPLRGIPRGTALREWVYPLLTHRST